MKGVVEWNFRIDGKNCRFDVFLECILLSHPSFLVLFCCFTLVCLNSYFDACCNSLPFPCCFFAGLDDQSIRSINGARVAERIIEAVPKMDTFCSTLRIIKHWARQRGIYSNVLGFLGGVNYAILVAFICQLYTNACVFTTVQKFFNVFAMWRWPNPILIHTFEDFKLKDQSGRVLPVWNPRTNYKDSHHLMPIITPAYPSMNSAYNVATPQFRCIQVSTFIFV